MLVTASVVKIFEKNINFIYSVKAMLVTVSVVNILKVKTNYF